MRKQGEISTCQVKLGFKIFIFDHKKKNKNQEFLDYLKDQTINK